MQQSNSRCWTTHSQPSLAVIAGGTSVNITRLEMGNLTNTTAEPASRGVALVAVISMMMASLILLTLLGNSLTITAFCLCRELRTITNYFLISLSVADFLTALLAMPIFLVFQVVDDATTFPGGVVFQKVWRSVDIVCGTASIWNLCLVSMDRCLAVSAPFRHLSILTPFRAKFAIVLLWAYSLALSSLLHISWESRGYFITCLSFFVPLSIIVFSYAKIYLVKTRSCELRRSGGTKLKRDLRSAKQMVLVIGVFVLCWVGFFVLTILMSSRVNVDPRVPHLIKALTYLNSCIDPVLFTLVSPKFKKAFLQMIRCQRPRLRSGFSDARFSRHDTRRRSDRSPIMKRSFDSDKSCGDHKEGQALDCTERETSV